MLTQEETNKRRTPLKVAAGIAVITIGLLLSGCGSDDSPTTGNTAVSNAGVSSLRSDDDAILLDPVVEENFLAVLDRDSLSGAPITYRIWRTDVETAYKSVYGTDESTAENARQVAEELAPWANEDGLFEVNVFIAEGDFMATMAHLPATPEKPEDYPHGRYLVMIARPPVEDGPPIGLGYGLQDRDIDSGELGEPTVRIYTPNKIYSPNK